MRTQHVGWDRLRGFVTGVGNYLRAGAGRPWRHNSFGGGCRGKTDRRCHGGHREDPRKPLDDVLPGTHRATLPTSPAAGLPTGHFGCHVHNFIKWTWQPLIPYAPGEPPHIPDWTLVGSTNKHVTVAPGCGSVPPKRRAAFIVRISYRALPSRSAEWRRVDWWREKDLPPTPAAQWLRSPRQVGSHRKSQSCAERRCPQVVHQCASARASRRDD
jgi:hypothetical protein